MCTCIYYIYTHTIYMYEYIPQTKSKIGASTDMIRPKREAALRAEVEIRKELDNGFAGDPGDSDEDSDYVPSDSSYSSDSSDSSEESEPRPINMGMSEGSRKLSTCTVLAVPMDTEAG